MRCLKPQINFFFLLKFVQHGKSLSTRRHYSRFNDWVTVGVSVADSNADGTIKMLNPETSGTLQTNFENSNASNSQDSGLFTNVKIMLILARAQSPLAQPSSLQALLRTQMKANEM